MNSTLNSKTWNAIVSNFDQGTLLQSWEWAQVKSMYGWQPEYFYKTDSLGNFKIASLMLTREQKLSKFGPRLKIIYIPHGPLLDWENIDIVEETLDYFKTYSRDQKAAYIKIDPQFIVSHGILDDGLKNSHNYLKIIKVLESGGWRFSKQQIQFKNTFWIDLSPSEDDLLMNMKQKTRYNIRLAEKKGVQIVRGTEEDIDLLYDMYAETSMRDGFIIRPKEYYFLLWKTFIFAGMAVPLIAKVENEAVASLFLFYFNKKSYYLYGMSRDAHREKMPNYLLQWEAIKLSKSLGCEIYDLWGAPEKFDQSDKMWGVYKFKEGLGGKVIQTLGAYDYPTSKFTYTMIQEALPKFQKITRRIRGKQIRDELAG